MEPKDPDIWKGYEDFRASALQAPNAPYCATQRTGAKDKGLCHTGQCSPSLATFFLPQVNTGLL